MFTHMELTYSIIVCCLLVLFRRVIVLSIEYVTIIFMITVHRGQSCVIFMHFKIPDYTCILYEYIQMFSFIGVVYHPLVVHVYNTL